jgi:hypothetical protein
MHIGCLIFLSFCFCFADFVKNLTAPYRGLKNFIQTHDIFDVHVDHQFNPSVTIASKIGNHDDMHGFLASVPEGYIRSSEKNNKHFLSRATPPSSADVPMAGGVCPNSGNLLPPVPAQQPAGISSLAHWHSDSATPLRSGIYHAGETNSAVSATASNFPQTTTFTSAAATTRPNNPASTRINMIPKGSLTQKAALTNKYLINHSWSSQHRLQFEHELPQGHGSVMLQTEHLRLFAGDDAVNKAVELRSRSSSDASRSSTVMLLGGGGGSSGVSSQQLFPRRDLPVAHSPSVGLMNNTSAISPPASSGSSTTMKQHHRSPSEEGRELFMSGGMPKTSGASPSPKYIAMVHRG